MRRGKRQKGGRYRGEEEKGKRNEEEGGKRSTGENKRAEDRSEEVEEKRKRRETRWVCIKRTQPSISGPDDFSVNISSFLHFFISSVLQLFSSTFYSTVQLGIQPFALSSR
jgi:hypothetical protein